MTDSLVSGSTALSRNKAGDLTPEAVSSIFDAGAHLRGTPETHDVPLSAL